MPRKATSCTTGSELELTQASCSALLALSRRPDPAMQVSSNLPCLATLYLLLTHPVVRSPSRLALATPDQPYAFHDRSAWVLVSA
jgi:hypothetical protein